MDCLALHVLEIEPLFATEEVLAYIGHGTFDVRFPLRMAHDSGFDHEAAGLRILLERALEDRIVAVGFGDRRFQVIKDQPFGTAAEELPCILDAVDQIPEFLRVGDVDTWMQWWRL